MKMIPVKFLGEDYIIPDTIKQFLEYDNMLCPIMSNMLEQISYNIHRDLKLNPSNASDNIINDLNTFRKIMEKGVDKVLQKLISLEVYDVTYDEILNNIDTFSKLESLATGTMKKICEEGERYINMRDAGMQEAYEYASSNITGSGITVFTSSLSSLFLYAAWERSIVSSQIKKAEKEYEKAICDLQRKTWSKFEDMCKNIIWNEYYPALGKVLSGFPTLLLNQLFMKLMEHGKFDFKSVECYNMEKANRMLSNIQHAPDKKKFLKETFLVCPFCYEIYEQCLNYKLLDYDTLKIAEYLGFSRDLNEEIKNQAKRNSNDIKYTISLISMISKQQEVDENILLKEIYSNEIKKVENKYNEIKMAIADDKKLDKFAREYFFKNFIEITHVKKKSVLNQIDTILKQIITQDLYDELVSRNILSPTNIRLTDSNSTSLEAINSEIKINLINKIFLFIDEANKRYNLYIQEEHKFNSKLKKLEDELESLKKERENLKIFDFSTKAKLDKLTDDKKEEIDNLKNQNTPRKYLVDFESMYRGYPYSISSNLSTSKSTCKKNSLFNWIVKHNSLCIAIFIALLVLGIFIFPADNNEKQVIGISQSEFNITTKSLDTYLAVMGMTEEEAKKDIVDQNFIDGLQDVDIVGYKGSVTHHITNYSENIISLTEWVSNNIYTEPNYSKFLDSFSEYYGQNFTETEYDSIAPKCFYARDELRNCHVITWFDSGRIRINWYLLNEEGDNLYGQ